MSGIESLEVFLNTPQGDAVGLMGDVETIEYTKILSDVGVLQFTYPKNGVFYDQVEDQCELIALVDGVEPKNGRFVVEGFSGDKIGDKEDAEVQTITGRSLLQLFEQMIVYPQNWPNTDPPGHAFVGVTAGTLLLTLMQRAQDRGCFPKFTTTFTDAVDSNGEPWRYSFSVTYDPLTNYLSVIQSLVAQGMCEIDLDGWAINLYNPGGSTATPELVKNATFWQNLDHWVGVKGTETITQMVQNSNIALGMPVTASKDQPDHDATPDSSGWAALTDGDIDSGHYVTIRGTKSTPAQWVQVDLGDLKLINSVSIWHIGTRDRTYYGNKTEVSIDGVNWDVIEQKNYIETPSGHTIALDQPRLVRYVRNWIKGSNLNYDDNWVEIQVQQVGDVAQVEVPGTVAGEGITAGAATTDWAPVSAQVEYIAEVNLWGTAKVDFLIELLDANGAALTTVHYSPQGTQLYDTPTTFTQRLLTPAGAAYARLSILTVTAAGVGARTFWVDEISLREAPSTLLKGRDIKEAPVTRTTQDLRTVALVMGDNNTFLEYKDTVGEAKFDRRETGISQGGVVDPGTLTVIGQNTLEPVRDARFSHVYGLVFPTSGPGPVHDYDVGDYLTIDDEGDLETLRLRQIVISLDASGVLSGSVTLNDRFDEFEVTLDARLNQLTGGSMVSGAAPAGGLDKDQTIPGAPSQVVVSSDAYPDSQGVTFAQATISWQAPETNTDGTAVTDLQSYIIEWKYATDADWQVLGMVDAETTVAFTSGLHPGWGFQARVRAVDQSNHYGPWQVSPEISLATDDTAPPVPSVPTIDDTTFIGTVRVFWDGKGSAGEAMPSDFDHVEVHTSSVNGFVPSDATLVDTMPTSGVVDVFGTPNEALYVRFISVDRLGHKSAASEQGSGSATPVHTGDIADGAVTDTKIYSMSVSKLLAGTITADVVIGNRFRTSEQGNRVEIAGGINGGTGGIYLYHTNGDGIERQKIQILDDGTVIIVGTMATGFSGDKRVAIYDRATGGSVAIFFEMDDPTWIAAPAVVGPGSSNDGSFLLQTGAYSDVTKYSFIQLMPVQADGSAPVSQLLGYGPVRVGSQTDVLMLTGSGTSWYKGITLQPNTLYETTLYNISAAFSKLTLSYGVTMNTKPVVHCNVTRAAAPPYWCHPGLQVDHVDIMPFRGSDQVNTSPSDGYVVVMLGR